MAFCSTYGTYGLGVPGTPQYDRASYLASIGAHPGHPGQYMIPMFLPPPTDRATGSNLFSGFHHSFHHHPSTTAQPQQTAQTSSTFANYPAIQQLQLSGQTRTASLQSLIQ